MNSVVSKKQFSIIFSSADENKPVNKSTDGTIFSVRRNENIKFPSNAFDCTAEVVAATVWNSVPNISQNLGNNKFYVFSSGVLHIITLPDGLYSVSSLNSTVSKSLVNLGLPSDIISITGNQSTQRIILTFNYVGTYVDFTQPNACRDILGFDPRLVPLAPSSVIGQSEEGDKIAEFNNIESFLIKTDLVIGNIPTNQDSDQTIALIPITAKTNEQIVFSPTNPSRVDASNLKGQGRDYATFRLTNEKGEPAQTNEDYSVLILFRYSVHQHSILNK